MLEQIWELAPIRVGVDLDRDRFIAWGSRPGDPLNLLPDPINYERYGVSGDWTLSIEPTEGGIKVISLEMTSAVDDAIYIGGEGTSPPVDASTHYRASIFVKGLDGEPLIFWLRDDNGTELGSTSFTGSADWQRVEADVDTDVSSLSIDFIVQKDSTAATGTLSVVGPMLVYGVTPSWNPGTEISLRQDITDYVIAANWQLGMSGPDERLCTDGEADLVLDNETRYFSPSWADGPLFGTLEPGIMMLIELQHTDEAWHRRWSGFVEEINPDPTNRQRTTQIKGLQGFTYLTERDAPVTRLHASPTAKDIIEILARGWTTPERTAWTLGVSRLGTGTYLWGPDGNIAAADGDTYTVFGEAWTTDDEKRKTRKYGNIRGLLQDLVEAEQGFIWLDEYGVLHFIDLAGQPGLFAAPEEISLDTDAGSAEYEYGNQADIANLITVKYYPRAAVNGTMAYSTDEFTVGAGASTKKTYDLEIDGVMFATEALTVDVSYASGSAGTVTAAVTLTSSSRAEVEFVNSGASDADIERVTLNGSGYSAGPDGSEEVYNTTSIAKFRKKELEIDNRFIETSSKAQALGGRILGVKALPRGRITGISIPANREPDWYRRMVELSLMDAVSLSEYQTGVENWLGLILGARYSWSPTLLQANFVVGEGIGNIFWVLGQSKLNSNTRLL